MTALQTHEAAAGSERAVTRAEVEDFLYAEAHLLDTQRYDDWLALFVEGARSEVPATYGCGLAAAAAGYLV